MWGSLALMHPVHDLEARDSGAKLKYPVPVLTDVRALRLAPLHRVRSMPKESRGGRGYSHPTAGEATAADRLPRTLSPQSPRGCHRRHVEHPLTLPWR